MMRESMAAAIKDFLDGCEGEYREADLAEAIVEALPGMVKPLEWGKLTSYSYRADAPLFGSIRIESYDYKKWAINWSCPGYSDTFVPGCFSSLKAAQAAANEHHRAALMRAWGVVT